MELAIKNIPSKINVTGKKTEEYSLIIKNLARSDIKLLRAMMQNPLHDDETTEERDLRIAIFAACYDLMDGEPS